MKILRKVTDLIRRFLLPEQYPQARRMIILVFGLTLLIIGILMIFLPGPALIVIPLSLAVLGTEFVWAQRLLKRLKKETKRLRSSLPKFKKK